ncbi:MAG TPA: hypothetical protein VMU09_13610, partial [Acidimicrobiales bacterium]|nr:hypothetical protein [Acidimicrobiales bacterium]
MPALPAPATPVDTGNLPVACTLGDGPAKNSIRALAPPAVGTPRHAFDTADDAAAPVQAILTDPTSTSTTTTTTTTDPVSSVLNGVGGIISTITGDGTSAASVPPTNG